MALSPKLQIIFEHLLPGEDVWDLCCDHGLLGFQALQTGDFGVVHFVDQVPHIVQKLQIRPRTVNLASKARFLCADAATLQEVLTGTVVIAGVGAYTAFEIVKTLSQKDLLRCRRLIVSPQRDETKFIHWMADLNLLASHRYQLRSEQKSFEGRRSIAIFVFGE
jgi:tRNA (adenine22-N1)-methyltransferase